MRLEKRLSRAGELIASSLPEINVGRTDVFLCCWPKKGDAFYNVERVADIVRVYELEMVCRIVNNTVKIYIHDSKDPL